MPVDSLYLSRAYAQQSQLLRRGLMAQLYATKAINPFGSAEEQTSLLLSDLLGSFKRYAGNQQTAYDSGSVQSGPTNTSNQWERVVDRAINQVLGKSPGKGANNFVNALDTAFPSKGYGRSTMTLSSGAENYSTNGLLAEISTEQAILYRQVSTNMTDALKVLARIQYFSPNADKESVEALRELIRGRINFLVEEFRRADEPRSDLVTSYLRALTEHTNEFGKKAFLNAAGAAVTIEDEEQVTNFKLFKSYLQTLRDAWAGYYKSERSGRFNSLSVRVDRARVLLPIVSQANLDFSNALESVGLSENERRSRASSFTALDLPAILEFPVEAGSTGTKAPRNPNTSQLAQRSSPINIDINIGSINFPPTGSPQSGNSTVTMLDPDYLSTWLPNITVSDLIDWLDRYSNIEAPSALESTYGIDFVTDQADRLFWTIAPVVTHLKTVVASNPSSQSMLKQILSNERVAWALDNILSQLNALAELAA
jgi:hypothetical protein